MIVLKEQAHIDKSILTEAQVEAIKNHFTIANPLFYKLESLSKATWGVPPRLKFYDETEKEILIPLGGASELHSIINVTAMKIVDKRFKNKNSININFKGSLRDYQQTASTEMTKRTIGTLQATTGSGKTIMAIDMICERKQPTLFLVNTIELANQFKKKLLKFTDIKEKNVGLIGAGKYEIRDVSVGILQTITKLSEEKIKEINNHFGQVFVDEVHIVPAQTFYSALNKLKAKYRFGLTATPFRSDGLTEVIFFTTGPIVHKIDPKEVEDYLIIPEVEYINTDYFFPMFSSDEHSAMLSDMALDETRNNLILETYEKTGKDKQVVFISHRTSQLEILQRHIPGSEILTSKVSKKNRAAIMERLLSGELRTVLTTFGLFSTGIDIPSLEIVYMCTPMRSKRWLVQTVGRLKRKAKGKDEALVVDFVDKKVEMLRNQYYARRSIWKQIRNQEI